MEPRFGLHNAVHAGVLAYHFVAFVPYCAARISSSGGEATYVPLKFGGQPACIAHGLTRLVATDRTDVEADKYFLPFQLACHNKSAKIKATALDSLEKLISALAWGCRPLLARLTPEPVWGCRI